MKRFYNLLIVFLPILSVYASPLPGFDLGTMLVVIFGIFCLIKNKKIFFKMNYDFAMIIGYTGLITILAICFSNVRYSSDSSIVLRTVRFILLLVIMIGIGYSHYFDFKYYIKILRKVTLFVAIYAIIQWIWFNITGLKLINVIGTTKQAVEFNENLGKYETIYRPPSIFLEPSSVTYFVIPYLCYCLFNNKDKNEMKRNIIEAVIISLGLLCTTSGQGIVALIAVWILWMVFGLFKADLNRILWIIPIIVVFVWISSTNIIEYSLNRVFNSGDSMSAIDARSGGYDEYSKLSDVRKIFGVGFGNYNEEIYYSSFADILCSTGIVGLLLVVTFYLRRLIKGAEFQKILVILSFVLMSGGGIYTASLLCFYIPILIYKVNEADAK